MTDLVNEARMRKKVHFARQKALASTQMSLLFSSTTKMSVFEQHDAA
jgi:hypothetical protein